MDKSCWLFPADYLILDVWQGCKYASDMYAGLKLKISFKLMHRLNQFYQEKEV